MGKEILFGRWLLKYANAVFVENALCWKFEDTNYDTHELYEIFIERECGGKKEETSIESVEVCNCIVPDRYIDYIPKTCCRKCNKQT